MKRRGFLLLLLALALSWTSLSAVACAQKLVPADAGAIQYLGRWDLAVPGIARTGRGAVYLRVDFSGTSLRACLQDRQNWWRYTIDGREYTKFKPQSDETLLADGLPPGRHQLLLVRCTEGRYGVSTLSGLKLDDDGELLPAAPASSRRMEIIGDSIAAGAKNDGPQGVSYLNREDGSRSFAAELARLLGAEWSVVAKSGEGVVHNYGEDWPGNGLHTQDTYPRTLFTAAQPVWNPAQFQPQAILINVGTNDFTDPSRKPEAAVFIAGYERLIRLVRSMNQAAVIISVEPIPAVIGPSAGSWARQAVETLKAEGDKKLYFIPVNEGKPLLQDEDYAGDGTHPTAAGAKKIAGYLRGPVAAIMGWD